MENLMINPKAVVGWGIDADPENDPTYPMKSHHSAEHQGYSWTRPPMQTQEVEVLCSTERPGISAVHGTSVPPAGLSGTIRRAAFGHSEDRYRRWLPLIVADRVGVVEGLLEDLAHGRVPNLAAEMGWRMLWKHNKRRVITRLALTAALVYAARRMRAPARR